MIFFLPTKAYKLEDSQMKNMVKMLSGQNSLYRRITMSLGWFFAPLSTKAWDKITTFISGRRICELASFGAYERGPLPDHMSIPYCNL